jgi:hypothetical protein
MRPGDAVYIQVGHVPGQRLINRTQVQGVSEYAGEVRRARLAS